MNKEQLKDQLRDTGRAYLPATKVPACTLRKQTIAPTRTSGVVVTLLDDDYVAIKDRGHLLSVEISHADGSRKLISSHIGLVLVPPTTIKRATEPWSVSRISS